MPFLSHCKTRCPIFRQPFDTASIPSTLFLQANDFYPLWRQTRFVLSAEIPQYDARRKVFCMNIYIGNLSYNTTEDTLRSLFAEFGAVENVKVIKDRFSGRAKGFGFVEMPSNSEADQAIKALNNNQVDGSHIKVRPADSGGKRRKRRPSRRRAY